MRRNCPNSREANPSKDTLVTPYSDNKITLTESSKVSHLVGEGMCLNQYQIESEVLWTLVSYNS